MTPRESICKEARTWLRTPYQHSQAVKGVGVDCARFPASVYAACGFIKPIDPAYSQDWHLHRGDEIYLEWIVGLGGTEITRDKVAAGDIAVWKWGRTYSHGGIFISDHEVIHSYAGIGVTIDDPTTHEELRVRDCRWFTFWP